MNNDARWFSIFLMLWFLAAITIGQIPWVNRPNAEAGLLIPVSVGFALTLSWTVPALRRSIAAVPIWALLLIHGGRWFGSLFLMEAGEGLDSRWAFYAGWGDIFVAVSAVALAIAGHPFTGSTQRKWLWSWNILGIVDILLAPATAVALVFIQPGTMSALRDWPLLIVPLFFVPVMIYSHVLITGRLLKTRSCMSDDPSLPTTHHAN